MNTSIFRGNDRRLINPFKFQKNSWVGKFLFINFKVINDQCQPGYFISPCSPPPLPFLPFPQLAKLSKESKTDVAQSLS